MNDSPNPEDMYREVEWMKPSDQPILQEMNKYGGWHTPKNLSLNLPFTGNWIGQRCRVLVTHELVERHPEDPGYRITEKGRKFLAGDLDANELERNSDT